MPCSSVGSFVGNVFTHLTQTHNNLICDKGKDKDMDSKFTTNRVKFDTLQMVLSVPRTLIYFAGFSLTTKRRQ